MRLSILDNRIRGRNEKLSGFGQVRPVIKVQDVIRVIQTILVRVIDTSHSTKTFNLDVTSQVVVSIK